MIRTVVFLYESLAQLAFVYPARRITTRPAHNNILNWIVAVSVAIQLATVTVPGLRTVLGLETIDATASAYLAAALAISDAGASILARATNEASRREARPEGGVQVSGTESSPDWSSKG